MKRKIEGIYCERTDLKSQTSLLASIRILIPIPSHPHSHSKGELWYIEIIMVLLVDIATALAQSDPLFPLLHRPILRILGIPGFEDKNSDTNGSTNSVRWNIKTGMFADFNPYWNCYFSQN